MIVVSIPSGLGNRIKGILIALQYTDNIKIIWPTTNDCGGTFEQLFETSWPILKKYPRWRHLPFVGNYDPKKKFVSNQVNWSISYQSDQAQLLDLVNNIRKFKIKDYIRKLADIDLPTQTLGISIRTWAGEKERFLKYRRPLEECIKLIYQYPGWPCYVATDDSEQILLLEKRFPDRQFFHYQQFNRSPRGTSERLTNDFVSMFILSRCPVIFVSPHSSYSECAWYLGECRAKVHII